MDFSLIVGAVSAQTSAWAQTAFMIVMFFAVFWLLVVLPRKREEKKHAELVEGLQTKDKIVTFGGIFGEIKKIKEKTVVIKLSENAEMEILKDAIARRQDD
ncbi:MAG: preprotein translocase subunit YajC [Solirubrobacterales bacterium]